MATQSVLSPDDSFDLATLRLSQATALVEMIGEATQYGPSTNLPTVDAVSGVIALLNQAHSAFLASRDGG